MTIFLKQLVNQGNIVCKKCKKEFDLNLTGLRSFKHHYYLVEIKHNYNTEEHRQKIKDGFKRRREEEKQIRESFKGRLLNESITNKDII